MRASIMVLVVGLIGCGGLSHRDYLEARSTVECKKIRTCQLGYYESEYRDFEDCVDDRQDDQDDIDDTVYDGCDYDDIEARACVSRINSMGCEDYVENGPASACDLVWDCND